MSFDLASFHLQLLKLRISASMVWDSGEEEQAQEPMGFGGTAIEVPDVEEDDDRGEDRLGFRH